MKEQNDRLILTNSNHIDYATASREVLIMMRYAEVGITL